MSRIFLRVYKPYTIEEVKSSLLIVGEVTGNCAKCGEMGLKPREVRTCPNCQAKFSFIASRRIEIHSSERFQFAKRMAAERPDLVLIDLSDFKKNSSSVNARELLG